MNEDEPMEREVAIDPEMLGKVFENLLDVKDRKSKGAFYTPREIVHYMCQETLINHLVTKSGLPEGDIRDFILYGDLMKDEDTTKNAREGNQDMLISPNIFDMKTGVNRLKELDNILANVKVADLAVGSGAFPLGMLNEIVKARETLSAYMSIGMNAFQKKTFYAYDRKPYDLKVNTIKNCIFACDIEPSAVDIAKLRLWLSIVIDDEISEDVGNGMLNEHSKPKQLPNLDYNIICGNSLIDEFKGNKLISESELLHNVSDNSQLNIYQGGVDSLINELIKLQMIILVSKPMMRRKKPSRKYSQFMTK
jgi:adenine-specific DNA-methyltransferase